jgi:antitoxin VapB
MALNIKNLEVENLASQVAAMTHVGKTEAIRVALLEKKERLQAARDERTKATLEWLRTEVWPRVPEEARGRLTREEEDEVLGYGPDGV